MSSQHLQQDELRGILHFTTKRLLNLFNLRLTPVAFFIVGAFFLS